MVELHFLPQAGGLRDQRPGEVDRLQRIYNIWRALWLWNHRDLSDDAKWVQQHPAEWRIVEALIMGTESSDGGSG